MPSISPFLTLKTSLTRRRSSVAPEASDAVHGQATLHEHVSKQDPCSFHDIRGLLASVSRPILFAADRRVNGMRC